MARPLRIEVPGGTYHVMSRGIERRNIVRDDLDRQKWLRALEVVVKRHTWKMYSWALMNNHFHLYFSTPHSTLSRGMHDLNSGYVNYFNRRHKRQGPLFQGRFKGILVENAFHQWEISRYIHLNPVRAGLVGDPSDFAWSSASAYTGRRHPPDWLAWKDLMEHHGRTKSHAIRAYRAFLAEGVAAPPESPLSTAIASSILGTPFFVGRIRQWMEGLPVDPQVPTIRALRREPPPDRIEQVVCTEFQQKEDVLVRVRVRNNVARAAVMYLVRGMTSLTLGAMGQRYGGVSATAVNRRIVEFSRALDSDRKLRKKILRCRETLRKFKV